MENAIKKAIEGGYNDTPPFVYSNFGEVIPKANITDLVYKSYFLDPKFWQALGKQQGWRDFFYSYYKAHNGRTQEFNGHWIAVETWIECPELLRKEQEKYPQAHYVRTHPRDMPEWKINAQQAFDWILQGKDINDFFNQLLK